MGFGRSRRRDWERDDRREGKAHPKLALVGAIVFAVGILIIMPSGSIKNLNIVAISGIAIMAGTVILLFSLSKRRQGQVVRGMDIAREIFKDSCQCCKCQNCGRSHNHWTHDDDDKRRRHY